MRAVARFGDGVGEFVFGDVAGIEGAFGHERAIGGQK
jgi:hypothetical protein